MRVLRQWAAFAVASILIPQAATRAGDDAGDAKPPVVRPRALGRAARSSFGMPLACLAFSPDGTTLATGGGWTGVLVHKEVKKGRRHESSSGLYDVEHEKDDVTVREQPHDTAGVKLWDVASGRERARFRGIQGRVRSVAFSADGARVVAAGSELNDVRVDEGRMALAWDVATGREAPAPAVPAGTPKVPPAVQALVSEHVRRSPSVAEALARPRPALRFVTGEWVPSADGSAFAVPVAYELAPGYRPREPLPLAVVCDPRTLKVRTTIDGPPAFVARGMALAGDGSIMVVFGSDGLRVKGHAWDAASGRRVAELSVGAAETLGPIGLSPDGRTLAAISCSPASPGGAVLLWAIPRR